MNNLISNEITKIFKKKAIYITLIITLLFTLLVNLGFKYGAKIGETVFSYSNSEYKEYLEEDLKNLNPNNPADNAQYIMQKTSLDVINLEEKYGANSWQSAVIETNMRQIINEYNQYKYGLEDDKEYFKGAEEKYNQYIGFLEANNWKVFAEENLKQLKEQVNSSEEIKKNAESIIKEEVKSMEESLYDLELKIQIEEWRITKDIGYNNEKDSALQQYYYYQTTVHNYENDKKEKTHSEKVQYQRALETASTIKYSIENDIEISEGNSLKGILENLFSYYELFIIIMIVMIAGAIVSEEFSKGTIKLLLIKPYSRVKILLAKYITILLTIVFSVVAVVLLQTIIGGIVFGFKDLGVPTLAYNFTTNSVMEMNTFAYIGILLLHKLPTYILVATIAFAFSTIFTNTPVAITISLLGYMSTSIINALVNSFNIKFMKFFITENWDLTQYLFGKLPLSENVNFKFSLIVCIIYFVLLIIPTFIVFKKKNIKNV